MNRSPGAVPALCVLSSIWGYNWVVMKGALAGGLGPFAFGAYRSALGVVVLAAVFGATRTRLTLKAPLQVAVLGLLQTTAFVTFSSLAVATGAAGKAAVLIYTMPFWTILLAWIFFRERPHGLEWPAIASGVLGLGLVLYPLDLAHAPASKAYATLGGLFWAGSVVYAKRLRANVELDLQSLTTWQLAFGSVPLIAFALLAHEPATVWTPYVVFAVAYNAVLGTALGWLLWLYIVGKLPVGVAGIASLASPLIGVFSAWLQLHEVPGPVELAGIVCIASALGLIALQGQRAARRAPATLMPVRHG